MNKIFIYTPTLNPRISYIFDLIFNQILGIPKVSLSTDLYAFNQTKEVAKINYSNHFIEDVLQFSPHSFLFETGIRAIHLDFKEHKNLMAAFFHPSTLHNQQAIFPFDPFALSFYLVSRYEEYLPFDADQFGRFSANNSQAYKHGFLQQPLVNLWAQRIKRLLQQHYPYLEYHSPSYQYTPTYDIDYAYAFLNKGWLRQGAAFAKNLLRLDRTTLVAQIKTWLRLQKDPYYTFDYLDSLDSTYQIHPIYFWLVGDYGTYDKNIHHSNKHFRELIQTKSQTHPIGIHPSFGSNRNQAITKKELYRLRDITQQSIQKSRQHFLMLQFPKTYSELAQLGIQEDYTMGYAQQLGFRASIAHPFYWYNLETEECTELQVFPFQLMDVTLNTYLNLTPKEAIKQAHQIIEQTKQVKGHLISIWHNNSFCEQAPWKGWRAVYEAILQEAVTKL